MSPCPGCGALNASLCAACTRDLAIEEVARLLEGSPWVYPKLAKAVRALKGNAAAQPTPSSTSNHSQEGRE